MAKLIGPRYLASGITSSATAFSLVVGLPVLCVALFGGVDAATWILILAAVAALGIVMLLNADLRDRLFAADRGSIYPLLGLACIAAIQLLPIGGSPPGSELIGVPASASLSMDPNATRLFLVRLVAYLVFFSAASVLIDSASRLRIVVVSIIAAGCATAIFGTMQRLGEPTGIYGIRLTPQAIPFATFINQHHFAAFMEMSVGLGVAMAISGAVSLEKRIAAAAASVVMIVAALMTGSRGGLLGMAVTVPACFLLHRMRRGERQQERSLYPRSVRIVGAAAVAAAILAVIVGVVIYLGGDDSLQRYVSAGSADGDVTSGRSHFWSIAVRMFLDHPILGVGFDAFGVAFAGYDTWPGLFRVEQAHNDYLQAAAEGGIPAALCLVWFIYSLSKRGFDRLFNSGGGFRHSAVAGGLAGCLGILVHSFVDFPLRTPSNAFYFLLIAAVATVNVASSPEPGISERSRRSRSSRRAD